MIEENDSEESEEFDVPLPVRRRQTSTYIFEMKRRILVVDDEPYNVLGMTMMINRLDIKGIGKIVDRAYNG